MNMFYAQEFIEKYANDGRTEKSLHDYAVSNICLSDCKQFWIAYGNSRAYVEYGRPPVFAGGSVYLLHIKTETIHTTYPSNEFNFIRDFHEERSLNGRCYILRCGCEPNDKKAMLGIKKRLDCSFRDAKRLIAQDRIWCTGRSRILEMLQQWFNEHDVPTSIEIVDEPNAIVTLDDDFYDFEEFVRHLTDE